MTIKKIIYYLSSKRLSSGQSIIELLIAIGISAIFIPALTTGLFASRSGKAQDKQRVEAISILKETQESVRSVREAGWAAFAVNGTYHPVLSGNTWTLVAGSGVLGDFTRSVDISDVNRDVSGNITSVGGTNDPSTKRLTYSISWGQPYSSSITSTTYLTRYLENLSFTQTSEADFTPGTFQNTAAVNDSGGEVILGAGGGGGDWCQPSKSITELNLPRNGEANAISAIEGKLFIATGENASGEAFGMVAVSSDDPPYATLSATLNDYKANGVFGEGEYGYLATDSNSKEVVIISLTSYSDPPTNSIYAEVGSIDTTGPTDGKGIYVVNNKAYILAGDKLYISDITNRSGTHTLYNSAGTTLSGNGQKIIVQNNLAYIVTSATSNQLQIINVSNPASPTITTSITLDAGAGRDLFINTSDKRAYVVTAAHASKREFFIIDIDPISPTYRLVKGNYDTSGMDPKGVTIVTGNRAIVVGSGGTNQYQVLNISNEAFPTSCAGLPYIDGVNGVASVLQSNGYAYSYIVTEDATKELKIILGGAGGSYSSQGTFTSNSFDVATSGLDQTAFNRFIATFTEPPQTTVGFQVAVAQAVSNSCTNANYTFIGPNLTSETTDVFTSSSSIPLLTSGNYTNPGRCFKYKVYFSSSDPTQTPVLEDFTVNYSP